MHIGPSRLFIMLPALFTGTAAEAYIGPGAGLSAIGSALALVGALLLMIVGFVWYPVKRFMKRRKATAPPPQASGASDALDTGDDRRDATPDPQTDSPPSRSP